MTIRANPRPAEQSAARAYNVFNRAGFTVGSKSANTINVAVQLKDARGQNISQIAKIDLIYLSDNPDGSTLTATPTTSAIAIGTNGVILSTATANKAVEVITNASGQIDLNIIQTTSPVTYYLVVCTQDGSIAISPAINF